MDISSIGVSGGAGQIRAPISQAPSPPIGEGSPHGDQLTKSGRSDQALKAEVAAIAQILQLLLEALSGNPGGGGGSTAPGGSSPDEPQASPPSGQSQPSQQWQPPQQGLPSPQQQLAAQPSGGYTSSPPTNGGTPSTPPPTSSGSTPTPSATPPTSSGSTPTPSGSGTSSGVAAAPAGGIDTTSTTGQREDVLIGSYTDPQNLADPGQIAKNPRVGLWLTQLGFNQSDTPAQQQATADAWQGKGYSLERATYAGGYGDAQSGGLHDQFTGVTGGKENLNTQTADVGDESGLISNADVAQFDSDLQSQRANGQNLLPVYGPNAAAGQPGSYTQGFSSPDFDNFRKLATAAGGFVLDAPPSLMNQPQYTQWYQDATKWAHANGLKVEWYASPAVGDTDPAAYQANVEEAVQNQNASGTNPDTYIFGNYVQNNPAATVASEEAAAQYVLNNTTPTAD